MGGLVVKDYDTAISNINDKIKRAQVLYMSNTTEGNSVDIDISNIGTASQWKTFLIINTYAGKQGVWLVTTEGNNTNIDTIFVGGNSSLTFSRPDVNTLRISQSGNFRVFVEYVGWS